MGPTGAWALKVAACSTAGDTGDSPLLPTPPHPHPHLCSLAFGSLALHVRQLLSDIICSQFP